MEAVISELIKQGGGYLIAALFIYLFLKEQKKNDDLYKNWMEDTKKSTETLLKSVAVLEKLPEGMAMLAEKIEFVESWQTRLDEAERKAATQDRRGSSRSGG